MTVLNKKRPSRVTKSLKNTSLILMASLLFACQGESSAEVDIAQAADAIEQSAGVTTIASDSAPSTNVIEETIEEKVIETEAAVAPARVSAPTPRAPADFSTLNPNTYKAVAEPFAVSSGNNIEITELFWFGCGHCFALEVPLKQWLKNKPANATFKKVPAIFSKSWEFHGKAFYTMEALKVPEEAYDGFFREIHLKRKAMKDLKSLTTFLAQYGKDEASVKNAFNSFAVDSKFRNAEKITQASGARGVPALIVDGKYITSQTNAGGTVQMFDVVDKLVAKAASER